MLHWSTGRQNVWKSIVKQTPFIWVTLNLLHIWTHMNPEHCGFMSGAIASLDNSILVQLTLAAVPHFLLWKQWGSIFIWLKNNSLHFGAISKAIRCSCTADWKTRICLWWKWVYPSLLHEINVHLPPAVYKSSNAQVYCWFSSVLGYDSLFSFTLSDSQLICFSSF